MLADDYFSLWTISARTVRLGYSDGFEYDTPYASLSEDKQVLQREKLQITAALKAPCLGAICLSPTRRKERILLHTEASQSATHTTSITG